jgi:hypothetical protein
MAQLPSSKFFRLIAAALAVLLVASRGAAQNYEAPKTYKASQVLPQNLQKDTLFQVAEKVRSDGYLYQFDVQSKFGPYSANGTFALRKLVYEILVLGELEQFTRTKVFVDAAKKGGVGIVTAPIKVIRNVADAAANPDQTWKTVKAVPQGVANLFSWGAEKARSGAESASSALSKDKKKEEEAGKSLAATAMDSAGNAAADYIGYNKNANKWYEKYNLDPYTQNKPLRDKISQIARVETAVNVSFRFVPGIGMLSIISDVNKVVETAKRLSLYADPKTLYDKNKLKLASLGVPEDSVGRFMDNRAFTPATRTLLVDGVERLNNVQNRADLIGVAAPAKTPEEAVFYARAIRHLADIHEKGGSLRMVVRGSRIPAVVSGKNVLLIPLPLDRIIWSKEAADILNDTIKLATAQARVNVTHLLVSGTVSPRFDSEVQSLGSQVQRNVNMESMF